MLVLVDTASSCCVSFPFVSTVTFSKCIKSKQTESSDFVSKLCLVSSQMEKISEHVYFLSGVHNQLIKVKSFFSQFDVNLAIKWL